MARSIVRTGNNGVASVAGLPALIARIEALPPAVRTAAQGALRRSAEAVLARMKSIAPVGDEAHGQRPGALRDSLRIEQGAHELSLLIIADPKDEHGHGYAKHVEYGHVSPNGGHVAAEPFFWPSVRVQRRRANALMSREVGRAIRAAAGGGGAA